MHYMENGGLGNGTFIIWAWLGSTRISRQVLSRWSWRQGRRMTKLCRSTTPRVLRRAEHEGLCTSGKNHNGWTWTGWAGGCCGPLVARVQRLWPRLQIRYFGSAWSPESSVCSAAAAGLPLIHLIIPSYVRGGEVGLWHNICHFIEADSQFLPSIFFLMVFIGSVFKSDHYLAWITESVTLLNFVQVVGFVKTVTWISLCCYMDLS